MKATLVLWQTKIIAVNTIDLKKIKMDIFGTDIKLQLSNDGSVTFIMNINNKERH